VQIGSSTIVASLTPGSSGDYVVTAGVAGGNFFSSQTSSTLPWECTIVVQSIASVFSPTAPGFTNTRGFTNVATTGTVFAGPGSTVEVRCHDFNSIVPVADPVADLTATRVSTVNGVAAAKPAHRRIMNGFPKKLPAGSPLQPRRHKTRG
jgi:hypothetical protein